MKFTALLLLIFAVQVQARGYSQTVTLQMRDAPVEQVFKSIRKQTGYLFVYELQVLRNGKKLDIQVENMPLDKVLAICFKDQPFTYTMIGRTIIVKPRPVSQELPVAPDQAPMEVHGKVTENAGSPIPRVSVLNKRTRKGTSTDAEGQFTMHVNSGDVLEFSAVGYRTVLHKMKEQESSLSITMLVEASSLNEVVLIGYGSSKRKDLTGSVSTVDTKDIQDIPFATIDNAIAGKAAGVQVTKSDGTPGGAVRIRVRGSSSLLGGNDPLYVIDGVPILVQTSYMNPGFNIGSPAGNDINAANGGIGAGMSAGFVNGLNSLGGLNIDDIENVTILKDASATAIYGSKAANGVVIINTKKGRKDMKPQIMLDYYTTVTRPINAKVLNADQYRMLITEAAQNDYNFRKPAGRPIPPNVDGILNHPDQFFGKANTNWLDLVTRTTYSHNLHLAVQGGGAASKYYTSISYNSTPGVLLGSSYQRIAGKINLENEIGKHFRFITNLDLGYTNQNITNGAYGQALRARPDYAPYDSTGNFTNFANVGASYQGFQNPLALTTSINNGKTLTLLGSVSAEYDFTSALRFKSTASLNSQTYNQQNYTPSYLNVSNFYGNTANNGGIGSNSNSRLTNWFFENTLSYDKKFNEKHAVNLIAGTSWETRKMSFFSATGSGYPNDNILNNLSSAITPLIVTGDNPTKPQSYLLSFYLRANYTLMDKYLFTFTGRSDGSSKFGPNNKFAYFPSGAIAWRLSQENFLKDVSWIEDLKARVSYGKTGSQNIGDQLYRTLYSPVSYAGNNALIPNQLGNPAIKWESTNQLDAGLDFAFFKGRLQGTFDYYKKETNGILLALPVAPSSSYANLNTNVANIRNTGYELSLSGDIIRTKDFKWSASVNITWNKSLVTKMGGADPSQINNLTGLETGNTTIIQGKPLGLVLGYTVNGIIRNQKDLDTYKAVLNPIWAQYLLPTLGFGDPIFALDSTGAPRQGVIGNCAPSYFGGFTQGFSWKNFDLNFYFTFSQGGKLIWADDVSSMQFTGTSNANAVMLKRYYAGNTGSDRPRLILGDGFLPVSNLNVYNASYLKLRTVALNYRFSRAAWMDKIGLRNAAVYVTASNLFTITKYPGNDPETSDDPYSVSGGYYDVSNYPPVRTFSLGLKFGF